MKRIYLIIAIFQFTLANNVISQVYIQDSLVLVNLYYASDGPNWQDQRNYLQGPVKTWHGISLSSDSTRVVALHLGGVGVSGYIHPSIGDLSELQVFGFTGSNLSGSTIPHTIGRLSKLRELWLWNNQLEGQIPDSICNMTALVRISIWQNNLSGTIHPCVALLPDLNNLTIQYNQFEGLPDLSQCPQFIQYRELCKIIYFFLGVLFSNLS